MMMTMTRTVGVGAGALLACGLASGLAQADPEQDWRDQTGYDGPYVVISPENTPRPPFDFDAADEALLDEIQRATFNYFWEGPSVGPAGAVKDRTSGSVVSCAGIGYQFGAIIIGVERGWITFDQGERRVKLILEGLLRSERNRKNGMFFHFLEEDTLDVKVPWDVVSTIDTPIMFAGALAASAYFGGEVAHLADTMVAECDWTFFQVPETDPQAWRRGMVSLGWEPDDWVNDPTGSGSFLDPIWISSADEEKLIYFIGNAAPNPDFRLDAELYYRLWRNMGDWRGQGPMSGVVGPLFRAFFAHLWIDYNRIGEAMGPDRPDLYFDHRSPIDWWEDSRRQARLHRGKATLENPGFLTVGEDSWGMSASDGPTGYNVPRLYPDPLPLPGAVPNLDVWPGTRTDNWLNGTVAPYTAGSMIMFEPEIAVDALRFFRSLDGTNGTVELWQDQYGFRDAYNLDEGAGGGSPPWVGTDRVGIDQGPLIIAIENARTGLIWDTFHKHPYVKAAMERLGLMRE